jgi:hypothetical protein
MTVPRGVDRYRANSTVNCFVHAVKVGSKLGLAEQTLVDSKCWTADSVKEGCVCVCVWRGGG